MLKGRCKEDFEKWLINDYRIKAETSYIMCIKYFEAQDFSMQYGVYVDFFDSVEIIIVDDFDVNEGKFFFWWIVPFRRVKVSDLFFTTRTEARQKAIEKAVKIYNSK